MALSSVTIIGAGIGGLTAALSLQKKGISVRVYEQASKLAEVGAGLHLSPNAIHVIRELDLRPALEPYDFRPRALKTRHYQTGVPSFELPLDAEFEKEFGTPFIDIHRADLHHALSDAVRKNDADAVILRKRLISLSEETDRVTLEFEDGSLERAETVLAADGVHSTIRSVLYEEPGAEFTGHVAYRGLVPTDAVGKELMEPDFNIWTGPGAHFVAYYLRRGHYSIMLPLSRTLTGKPNPGQARQTNRNSFPDSRAGTRLFASLSPKQKRMNVLNGRY